MSFKAEFKSLLKKLSQDPKLREAIHALCKNGDKNFAAISQGVATTLLVAGRFVGKGRMKTFIGFVDAAIFLISLSLLVKQNIFDRPEVREFLAKSWRDINKTVATLTQIARDYVDKRLASRR